MTGLVTLKPAAEVDDRIPTLRLVRVELRKLIDTRANRWLLATILATTPVVVAVMLFAVAPRDLTFDRVLDITQTPQKVLLPAVGILAVTSEWSQRTGLVTFTLVPDRGRVLRAKFAAVLMLGTLVILTVLAAAALGTVLGQLRGGSGSFAIGVSGASEVALVLLTGLVQGVAFGMALLHSAAAISLFYVVPNIWSVLFSASSVSSERAAWFDLNQAQGPLYDHAMTAVSWIRLLSAVTVWVFVPLVVGLLRLRRAEIK